MKKNDCSVNRCGAGVSSGLFPALDLVHTLELTPLYMNANLPRMVCDLMLCDGGMIGG